MLKWIKGILGVTKELPDVVSPVENVPTTNNISEPVYAIAKATYSIKRWKFYCNGYTVICTDKITKREYVLGLTRESYWYGIESRHSVVYRILEGDGYILCNRYGNTEPFKVAPLELRSYENVFNEEEQAYLSKAFSRLCGLKLKQLERVYQHKVYLNDKKKAEAERTSIRMGIELREKMMGEYCNDAQ